MGLFDKFKKVAKESMQATGIADVLQKQADDVRLAMKYGVTATPKNLEIAREKEAAERKAKEEAERRAQEEAERKAIEEAERRKREEAELRAQKEAERKAREEAERKAKEDAALEDVRLEEARLAQIEANRQRQAELDRKEFEDAKRKAQMEAELRAMKEAEEKAQAEAHQQKLAKEQEEKQNVLAPIKDYVEKAENGDGQAACQIGLWFQHGQKGLPQDMEQAKYWYQQAMVLGNQNAATFLNILVGNEQNNVNTAQKQKDIKEQEKAEHKATETKGILNLDGFEFLGNYMTYHLRYEEETEFYITFYAGNSFDEEPQHEKDHVNYDRWVPNCEFAVYMKPVGGTTIYRAKSLKNGNIYQIARGNFRGVVGCTAHSRKETLTLREYALRTYDVVKEYEYEDFNSKFIHNNGTELRLNI